MDCIFLPGHSRRWLNIRVFFSDHANNQMLEFAETPFGQILASRGLNNAAIAALAENPVIKTGGQLDYAFNLTEEINADSAAQILGAEVFGCITPDTRKNSRPANCRWDGKGRG